MSPQPVPPFPGCVWCRHLLPGPPHCRAFPNGIPHGIQLGIVDHLEPLADQDNDVTYEPIDNFDEHWRAGKLPAWSEREEATT